MTKLAAPYGMLREGETAIPPSPDLTLSGTFGRESQSNRWTA
jgi:hypothetical protein